MDDESPGSTDPDSLKPINRRFGWQEGERQLAGDFQVSDYLEIDPDRSFVISSLASSSRPYIFCSACFHRSSSRATYNNEAYHFTFVGGRYSFHHCLLYKSKQPTRCK